MSLQPNCRRFLYQSRRRRFRIHATADALSVIGACDAVTKPATPVAMLPCNINTFFYSFPSLPPCEPAVRDQSNRCPNNCTAWAAVRRRHKRRPVAPVCRPSERADSSSFLSLSPPSQVRSNPAGRHWSWRPVGHLFQAQVGKRERERDLAAPARRSRLLLDLATSVHERARAGWNLQQQEGKEKEEAGAVTNRIYVMFRVTPVYSS